MPADQNTTFRLSVLYDLSLYLAGCNDCLEVLSGIVHYLRALLPIDYAWLIEDADEIAVLTPAFENAGPGIRKLDRLCLESLCTEEPEGIIADLSCWKTQQGEDFFPSAIQSAMAHPLQWGKNTDACLIVASHSKNAYTPDQAWLFFLLALQVRPVLRNIRLRHTLEKQNTWLTSIFAALDEGLVLIDAKGNIAAANPALARTVFPEHEPERGQSWYDYLLQHKDRFLPTGWLDLAASLTSCEESRFPLTFMLQEAKNAQPVLQGEYHLAGGQGESRQLLAVIRDASERAHAEAIRRDLTAMLVHDLRSPLGIINWNMELMLDGVLGEVTPEQERFLQGSIESTQELLDMVDSLLDIDRLETGALLLEYTSLDLVSLTNEIARRMEFVTHQLQLKFEISFQDGFPSLMADKQLIRRVLFNLFFNASKYAPRGSTIHVSGSYSAERVSLAVEDEGKGIPEKYLDLIFDKYVQAEARNRGEVKGKGLGLTFCRLAIEAHGGSIRAENGIGARFVFELPYHGPEKSC